MILYNINVIVRANLTRCNIPARFRVIFKLKSALLNINNEYNNINKEYK